MKSFKMTCVTLTALSLLAVTVPSGISVYASEVNDSVKTDNTNTTNSLTGLEKDIVTKNSVVQILKESDENTEITKYIGNDNIVSGVKIYNENTKEKLVITHLEGQLVIEKTEVDENGDSKTTLHKYDLGSSGVEGTDSTNSISPRTVWDKWQYTGIAIPDDAVRIIGSLGADALAGALAGLFGVSEVVGASIMAYMGIHGFDAGATLVKKLDTNGNGWIGLHYRNGRPYAGGPVLQTEYKTE